MSNGPKNSAFVFVKPHAVTPATTDLVSDELKRRGITILSSGELSAEEIDSKKLIDQHYYAIASKATLLKPENLPVPKDRFQSAFGLSWEDALAQGKVFNALDACKHLGISAADLDAAWAKAKKEKFGGGFYCGLVSIPEKPEVYVFNGFFMSMRSKFVEPGSKIVYYVVEWDPATLSWADFRGKVLGPTNPADAPEDSVRGQVLKKWKELGLAYEPNTGDNGVHASASPFEGLAERLNWLGVSLENDPFGAELLAAGISAETIKAWSVDPQVTYKVGDEVKKGSLFDTLEDLDAGACIEKAVEINKGSLLI
jgi:nucleoside diphosphate kinase